MEHPDDTMTGLPGGKALKEEIDQRLDRCEHFAVAVIDVDNLASLNYDLTHSEGDKLIIQIARLLTQAGVGTVYRTGGDEFALVMPQVTLEMALSEASRLCGFIANHNFALADGRAVTVTTGVVHSPSQATGAQVLLDSAAEALAHAKQESYLLRQALRPS